MNLSRKLLLLSGLASVGLTLSLRAEDFFLRAGATGAETGKDWNNAWSRTSQIKWGAGAGFLGAGDVLWIAGGSYGNLTLAYDGGVNSSVTLRRADAANLRVTQAPGWAANYDQQVIISFERTSSPTDFIIDLRGNWYVKPTGTGAQSGVDWPNAWAADAIQWPFVHPGDTLWLAGGTYPKEFHVGTSGTKASPVKIRVAPEAGSNAPVLMPATLRCHRDYITIDGSQNGSIQFKLLDGVDAYGAKDIRLFHLEVSGGKIGIASVYGSGGEIGHCWIHDIQGAAAIQLSGKNQGVNQYDLTKVYNNRIQVNSIVATGLGPDGIQACNGLTLFSNHIYGVAGTVVGEEHQDLIQGQGTAYHKIYANVFENSSDALIGVDSMGSPTAGRAQIYNNVFRSTTGSGTVAIRYYNSFTPGTLTQFLDLAIDNNTFVDLALQTNYGLAIRLDAGAAGNASVQNTHIRNNVFVNCGGANPVVAVMGSGLQAGWDIDYNLLHPGSRGSADIQFVNRGDWTQAHGQSALPSFLAYQVGATNNNFRLGKTDAAARDKGIPLSDFAQDQDGVARPQGSGWDLGAFEVIP